EALLPHLWVLAHAALRRLIERKHCALRIGDDGEPSDIFQVVRRNVDATPFRGDLRSRGVATFGHEVRQPAWWRWLALADRPHAGEFSTAGVKLDVFGTSFRCPAREL